MKRILTLLLIALCLPASAGPLGNQLRAIAAQVDAEEAEVCPVCPTCPDPEDPDPPVVGLPQLSLLSNDAIPTTPISKPGRAGTYTDPTYGTTVTRATMPGDGGGTWSRHIYSRRQPWNADGSYYLATSSGGYLVLYNATTFAKIKTLPSPPSGSMEPIWHPTNPKLLLHTGKSGAGGVWYWHNVDTGSTAQAFSLIGRAPFPTATHWHTRGEGTISADGTKMALMAEKGSVFLGLVSVNVTTGAILGSLPAGTLGRPDHVSITPSGRWVVPSWSQSTGSYSGTRAYSLNFQTMKQLFSNSTHSDLAIGPEGHDYYVYADYSAETGGYVRARNIDTGASFVMLDLYPASGESTAIHISGQAFARPGWVTFSTHSDRGGNYSIYKKVMVAELKPSGKVYNAAHIRTSASGYWGEPQAAPSRDLTKIAFASNLGSGEPDSWLIGVGWR